MKNVLVFLIGKYLKEQGEEVRGVIRNWIWKKIVLCL
jgi:hypothetical protein